MMDIVLNKEMDKQYIDAVKGYEGILINSIGAPIDAFINLAFLYWEFSFEFIFNETYQIPDEWSEIGGKRYSTILKQGLINYPNSVELHFWGLYFPHILFNSEFTEKDCEEIIHKYGDDESLAPYFFLYLFDKGRYKKQRDELLKQCIELPTAKNLYIKSIIG